MQISWNKCQNDNWCSLNTVDLNHSHFDGMEGVYVIWYLGNPGATVRIGQGVIRDRLQSHRQGNEIQAFSSLGLFVTWASLQLQYRDGVEAYLGEKLKPIVGDRFPNAAPIAVNLPWE